jgi:hypothetical protein
MPPFAASFFCNCHPAKQMWRKRVGVELTLLLRDPVFIGVAAHTLQAIGTERYCNRGNVSKTPFVGRGRIDNAPAIGQTDTPIQMRGPTNVASKFEMATRLSHTKRHQGAVFDLRRQGSYLARFNRQLPRPFPSGPRAPRAFVTTAPCYLVSDRDDHFATGTRCG